MLNQIENVEVQTHFYTLSDHTVVDISQHLWWWKHR